jgi:dihydrofolate synthase/folylpolyglutamate synthase
MNGEEAIAYIHSFQWNKHAPGLDRIAALLHALGDPQKTLKFVHVAGTNGKGSTCACLAAVLQEAGYRVGLNTSPYINCFRERIQVDGVMISDEELAALTEEVRPAAEAMAEHPTEFELILAIALLYFQRKACDIVVLEVGMGGALDASNIIDVSEAAVIAALGMDHVRELGPTLADIAAAKAGIIKSGGAVVSYGGAPEADAVIRRMCARQGSTLHEVDFSRITGVHGDLTGNDFTCAPYGQLHLPLAGAYQPRNALLAITALEVLMDRGWRIPREAVIRGLAKVRWPGRFELLHRDPVFLLDGAHNDQGMAAAAESLASYFPQGGIVFLLGVMADKDVAAMVRRIAPLAGAFVAVRPNNPRAMEAEELATLLRPLGAPVHACGSIDEGVRTAMALAGRSGAVCALGSLYFSGDVRRAAEACF